MTDVNQHGWLVEWDGGFETADSPKAGEKFIKAKMTEWDDADRAEFSIVRNEPDDHRIEVWQRGDRIAVYRDGQPVGRVTKVRGATFSRLCLLRSGALRLVRRRP